MYLGAKRRYINTLRFLSFPFLSFPMGWLDKPLAGPTSVQQFAVGPRTDPIRRLLLPGGAVDGAFHHGDIAPH